MHKSKVAILTTVANFELYSITSKLFPKEIRKYIIDGRDGMHGIHSMCFMIEKLKYENIDWLIMADEDAIFKNAAAVFSIIKKMEKENITVAGVRDGGVVKHRKNNPYMINTFFSILNFKEVLRIWDKQEVIENQYIKPNEFDNEKLNINGEYDVNNLYEPYYCFYLWLKRLQKKFLYLEANMHADGISNTVLINNEVFLCHTWYARSYGVNKKQTKRINNLLSEVNIDLTSSKIDNDITIFKDVNFAKRQKRKKLFRKIKNKLSFK